MIKLILLLCLCASIAFGMQQLRITEQDFERIYGKRDARCPVIDIKDHPVHLPSETNPKHFYKCYMGRAYLMECPSGLVWIPELDKCNDKRLMAQKVNKKNSEECPEVDDPQHPVHYPHPFECNYFFKCANGAGVLFECPPGLHFSTFTDRCERPEDAKCQIN